MRLKFSIKSSTHYLIFLRKFVSIFDKLSSNKQFDHNAKMKCTLALVEAVNNVIFHAHHKDEDEWIDIAVANSDNKITIEVHDSGPGFDMPEFDVPPVDHTHGRGMFIINSLMNEVKYRRGESNVLKMVYYLETL